MSDYFTHPNRRGAFPPVVQSLLIGNCIIFLLQVFGAGDQLIYNFALWPVGTPPMAPDFQLWQLVTYSFLHGGLLHLFFNMFVLWMFGTQMEYTWGSRRFLIYYFFCVIGAGLTQLAVVSSGSAGGIYPTIGASGGVFGILLAFAMRFPNQYILLLIPPIPMKAKYFVLIIGAITLYFGMSGTAGGIAHFAHLGGMIAGLVLILYWRGHLPFKPRDRMR